MGKPRRWHNSKAKGPGNTLYGSGGILNPEGEDSGKIAPRIPEMPRQEMMVGKLGLCQSCGVEWGTSHVSVQATVIEQYRTRILNQMFWLCEGCRESLARKMRQGDGQAERVAWSLTHG